MAEEIGHEPPPAAAEGAFWTRVQEHKVIQWGVGYLGAALALAHGAELVTHALHWPDTAWRIVVLALIVGFPIALTVAWYHGQKGLQQVSTGELSIISVLVLIGAVFFTAVLRPHDGAAATETRERSTTESAQRAGPSAVVAGGTNAESEEAGAPPTSVAVMPFVNTSSDPDQDSFAGGLSSELINSLNRVHGLAVAGAVSSFYFKGKNETPATIGATLNVANLLNGNVQKSGDRLRVTVELVNARTGRRLWGETYERTFDDVFAIQDEIAKQVAEALQIALGVGDLGRQPGMTRDVAAYEQYLKAEGYFREFRAESFVLAIEHYQRAIDLDERFSAAWMAMAAVYSYGAQSVASRSVEWRQAALAAVERARALTPDLPAVLAWDARRNMDRGSWREAAVFLQERLPELRAGYSSSIARGQFLWTVGRSTEAIPFLEQTRTLEPLDASVAVFLGEAYASSGAFSQALAEFDRGLQLGGFGDLLHGFAVSAALASHDRAEIERHVAALAGGDPHRSMAVFLDDPAAGAAEARRRAASESPFQDFVTPTIFAVWAAYYGDAETALAILRDIPVEGNSAEFAMSLWRPVFRDVRKQPGFKDLVSDLGLVEYWREYGWSDFCHPVGENDFECQ